MRLNLADPADHLAAFVKARSSLGTEDVAWHFSGRIGAWEHGRMRRDLFGFEAFTVGRAVAVGARVEWLSREALLFTDIGSGAILDHCDRPDAGVANEVEHLWVDRSSSPFPFADHALADGVFGQGVSGDDPRLDVPVPEVWGDEVHFPVELVASSDVSRGTNVAGVGPNSDADAMPPTVDVFRFAASRRHVEDASPSAPCEATWVRFAPWFPWMGMGERGGGLVVHGCGRKLSRGFDELPRGVKDYIVRTRPEFGFAPAAAIDFGGRNARRFLTPASSHRPR